MNDLTLITSFLDVFQQNLRPQRAVGGRKYKRCYSHQEDTILSVSQKSTVGRHSWKYKTTKVLARHKFLSVAWLMAVGTMADVSCQYPFILRYENLCNSFSVAQHLLTPTCLALDVFIVPADNS